ncbi:MULTISPECIES: futalosine hydrolase [Streptomyces]|uniref:futalosine hydrolase n=1 Tax=Streptomyces TaxID=1883 RepID=UPI0004CB3953|nr:MULTISPECIES: futalosine hydrolase [Streptomyces]NDZ66638.1 futalosine hydrolase [Streptomyces cyaneofuscatus]ONI54700.1 Futalosine hydrolase [Streptomyces sp. IB2014 011-1]RDV53057.1 futalosine hydrolase [Streptomyces sp. IB2014 011-12]CAD5962745.1 Futalosine hydrolase [Streptomyces sp. KY70]CAD5979275.1 Futalosine hydrolase [Streptomyces sp. KY75]
MRVLVVTAVPVERDAVTRAFGGTPEVLAVPGAELHRCGAFDVLAGGAGPAAAAAAAAFALASSASAPHPYGLVISAGIGGGFAPAAPLGSLVVASDIVAADLGAETPDGFLPVTALGFGRDRFVPPPALVREVAAATGAAPGPVLTVSTVTGTAARTAALLAAHPGALAEAMEGFGVAEAAERAGVPVLELRAVSNTVGPRDRDAWRIGDALAALTEAFGKSAPVLEGWNRHDH